MARVKLKEVPSELGPELFERLTDLQYDLGVDPVMWGCSIHMLFFGQKKHQAAYYENEPQAAALGTTLYPSPSRRLAIRATSLCSLRRSK